MNNRSRLFVAISLVFASLVFGAPKVSATTQIFYEPFTQGWTAGSTWSLATGANYTAQIWPESSQTPQYALRLTSTATSRSGGLIYNRPIPTSSGLDVSFTFSMWGGTGWTTGSAKRWEAVIAVHVKTNANQTISETIGSSL